ncbi:MAG TPA: hypothetical protein DCR16_00510 [Lachnospiraceae bacterium]|jgi:hypothetical protein|nr:hypothetical protein [Lachnospiraceae bacterium]
MSFLCVKAFLRRPHGLESEASKNPLQISFGQEGFLQRILFVVFPAETAGPAYYSMPVTS